MTRDEAKKIVMMIDAMYVNWKPQNLSVTTDAWFFALGEFDYGSITKALKIYMQGDSKGFAPAPGQLISIYKDMNSPVQMSELEAWTHIYKAICNSTYNSEAEFAKLPEILQRTVGSPAALKQMASMDEDTVKSVHMSHTIRTYRSLVEKQSAYGSVGIEHQNVPMIG